MIACVALFVAMGGVGYAALKGKDKKKVRAIADQEITKQAPGLSVANAGTAANAGKLGGASAADYQRFCSGGAIKAMAVVNTAGASDTSFTNVPGFNCFQPGNLSTSVQVERLAQGQCFVRFVGNSGPNASGSAQATMVGADGYVNYDLANPSPIPGENVFLVIVHNAAGNPVDNRKFSLLAF
ncbi:MAG TPA: hypothetical protein VLB79_04545 [Solirubrobacterales bacterium]|nr:hypothetical protein [Solirubrobacterales bacterium]